MAAILPIVSLAATAVGTIVSMVGQQQQAEAAQAQANYNAKLAEMKGKEEFAAGQRRMLQERQQKDVAISALRARAAAGGGDTTDTSVVTLGAGIEQQGELRALTEFYKGDNAQRGYQDAAAGYRFEGQNAAAAAGWKMGGTLLSGISSFGSQYAKLYG